MQQKLFHKYPVYKFLPKKEAKNVFWHFLIPHMCTRHIRNNKKCLKSGICFFFLIVGDCLQSVSQANSAPSTTSFSCTGGNCLNLEVALVIDSVRFNSLTVPTFNDVSWNDRKNNPPKILCSFHFHQGSCYIRVMPTNDPGTILCEVDSANTAACSGCGLADAGASEITVELLSSKLSLYIFWRYADSRKVLRLG